MKPLTPEQAKKIAGVIIKGPDDLKVAAIPLVDDSNPLDPPGLPTADDKQIIYLRVKIAGKKKPRLPWNHLYDYRDDGEE